MDNPGQLGSRSREATGIIDIHAHLLPGIDDGPADLDGALALARAAADSGVQMLAATPHLRGDFPAVDVYELSERCNAIQEAIDREAIDLRVVSGAEVSLTWALDANAEQLRLASYQQRGRDLLVETPASGLAGVEALLYQLRLHGFRVTLAHPERGASLARDRTTLARLAEHGVLLQVNADALVAKRRSASGRVAAWLCTEGLVHALASDGHRADSWRPVTVLAEAVTTVIALVGQARAQWMTSTAPAAIVSGVELATPPSIARRRRWLGVLR